jgi:predicted nucleotidyltransferase
MASTPRTPFPFPAKRYYTGADVPMRVIRRYARAIAERFRPDKIVLFGSYAYGTPHEDSDVDLLVIMPARNQLDQAFKIRCAFTAPFPMDLIVRTPKEMKWRLEEGESFLTEVVSKGKVLYESGHGAVGEEGRGRSPRRQRAPSKKSPRA